MQILGLEPVVDTIVFTVIGLAVQNIFGWLKNATEFNIINTVASTMIAFFTSVFVVDNTISTLPDNIDALTQMLAIVGVIGTVAGFDTLIKNGTKAALQTKKSA